MALTFISLAAVLMFVLGTPIVLLIALWVAATSYWVIDFPLTNMGLSALDSLKSFAFLAVPLFICTGDFLTAGGLSQRLIGLAKSLVAFLPGRTAATAVLASGMFAAVSGSNAATAATMGQLVGPEMKKAGVPDGLAGAIVASGGTLGVVIPPSTIFIIYGITMGVSPVDLNLGGLLPGLLMMSFMMAFCIWLTRRNEPADRFEPFTLLRNIGREAAGATLGLIAVALLFFGLYLGWFSSTEAAGVATIYCLLVGLFVTRRIGWRKIPTVLQASAAVTGIIAPMVAFSLQFQQILSVLEIQSAVQDFLSGLAATHGPSMTIVAMMGIILVVGCITESVAVVLILAPILGPVAVGLGVDPVHWGVAFVIGTSIGFITPPYGLNLFVTSAVMGVPYAQLVKRIAIFLVPLLIAWAIVVAAPDLTLSFLPSR
ncbi:TRAP transporter large permease [Ramlibacter sp.]|uniref:TRAP transporter large permease n=1 Tax=Ramlibacter sp. TaxID=1917967 RepID=UPI002FC87A02